MDRERSQLVIGLGEGPEGRRLREALDRAAARTGKPVSVWARETLLVAAGDPKGEAPIDPIIEGRLDGREPTLVDLRLAGAVHRVGTTKVSIYLGGEWVDIATTKQDEVIELWKRVRRWGFM